MKIYNATESNLIDQSVFEDMPIQDIKEKEVKTDISLKEEKILVPDIAGSIRQPSKIAKSIMSKILKGEEHEDGGTFDNWIVSLVACCVLHDKRSDLEIKSYFEEIKHVADKDKKDYQDPDYIVKKIENCRSKFNKPDPGPQITKFFNTVWDCEFDKYYDLEKNKHRSDRSIIKSILNYFQIKLHP